MVVPRQQRQRADGDIPEMAYRGIGIGHRGAGQQRAGGVEQGHRIVVHRLVVGVGVIAEAGDGEGAEHAEVVAEVPAAIGEVVAGFRELQPGPAWALVDTAQAASRAILMRVHFMVMVLFGIDGRD